MDLVDSHGLAIVGAQSPETVDVVKQATGTCRGLLIMLTLVNLVGIIIGKRVHLIAVFLPSTDIGMVSLRRQPLFI